MVGQATFANAHYLYTTQDKERSPHMLVPSSTLVDYLHIVNLISLSQMAPYYYMKSWWDI